MTALRWYGGLALVIFGILPTVMIALLVNAGRTPSSVGYLLLVGIPLVGAAAVFLVRGLVEKDPEQAARRLHLSMALVAGADLVLLGGNALLRMGS
ncbi:hypothetical protein [Paractinoplanes lichenicola]|uniref:hypothetical protein n=1 Tax=Paractinoplanes lichenicola TaxID=2802976 RepID=UPI0027DD35EA|nr:hypothetical protein [Actinoplanes lichenicola]